MGLDDSHLHNPGVKRLCQNRSGSDGILTIPRNLMNRSLPLAVLTRTVNAWARGKPARSHSTICMNCNQTSLGPSATYWTSRIQLTGSECFNSSAAVCDKSAYTARLRYEDS